MSEAYTYGGNGSLERVEYNELTEQALAMSIEKATAEIELIFQKAHPSRGVTNYFSQDEEGMYRHLESAYTATGTTDLLFDTDSGSLIKLQSVSEVNSVKLEYGVYASGVLREEYLLKLEQNDPGVHGGFSTRYHLSHYSGDHWQATVEHLDVENDDFNMIRIDNKSKYYTRDMTPYDFKEFFKDTAQIKDQLGIVLVQ